MDEPGTVKRTIETVEVLELARCPRCQRTVSVSHCNYSSFNPGTAECDGCNKQWELGYVDDDWDAGQRWNQLQVRIMEDMRIAAAIKRSVEAAPYQVIDPGGLVVDARLQAGIARVLQALQDGAINQSFRAP